MAARRPPGPVRENSLSSFKELQMSTAKQALDKALAELAKTANSPKVSLTAPRSFESSFRRIIKTTDLQFRSDNQNSFYALSGGGRRADTLLQSVRALLEQRR